MAGMWIVGEDMPQEKNAVTLNPTEKDQFGLPIPNVHYDDHANDVAMRNYAFKRGAAVYDAVGATKTDRGSPVSVNSQPRHLPAERKTRRRGVQQMGPDPRHQEPVHFGWQPVHHQRGRESHADDRDPGNSPGRLHRGPMREEEYLMVARDGARSR